MTRQLKWGLGALVLIIVGFAALQIFLYIDMKNFERGLNSSPKVETETPTTPNVVISEGKPKEEPIQPIEPHEVDIVEVPHEKSQPNDSVENVTVKNYLEGLTDIDLFESITLPTDAELASYTDEEIKKLYKKIHEAILNVHKISEKISGRVEALTETQNAIFDDINSGVIDYESGMAKRSQLLKQSSELQRILGNVSKQNKQWIKEHNRIRQNTKHYGREF